MYEDNIGLRAIATVTDEQIIEKARNKELRGWSFGFVSEKDSWEEGESGVQKRSIEKLELLEVSILDMTPAYVATSIETRGEQTAMIEMRREETAVQTVVDDEREERNHLIQQIKQFWREYRMKVKEILNASLTRTKSRLAELQSKVEKMRCVQKN